MKLVKCRICFSCDGFIRLTVKREILLKLHVRTAISETLQLLASRGWNLHKFKCAHRSSSNIFNTTRCNSCTARVDATKSHADALSSRLIVRCSSTAPPWNNFIERSRVHLCCTQQLEWRASNRTPFQVHYYFAFNETKISRSFPYYYRYCLISII